MNLLGYQDHGKQYYTAFIQWSECFFRLVFHPASAHRRLVKASKKSLAGANYKRKNGEMEAKRVPDN